MIGNCPTLSSSTSLARDALDGADCLIAGQVEGGYAALLAPGGGLMTALTLALTIYVAIVGYRLVLGHGGLSLGELVPHFVKIGVVLALATNWPAYETLVFNLLFHGPEQLADTLTGSAAGIGATHHGILEAVQILFDRLTDYAGNAWTQHAPATAASTATTPGTTLPVVPPTPAPAAVPGAPLPGASPSATPGVNPAAPAAAALPFALGAAQFVAVLLWFAAIVMMAASVGVLLVVRIILALLLLLGPVFVACALFAPSRGLFVGWLRTTVKFALVPLFTLPLTAAMIAVAGPLGADLGDTPITSVREGPVLLIVLVMLVFAAVMWQAARLGGGIAGGIRWPRFGGTTTAAAPAVIVPAVSDGRMQTTVSRAEILAQTIDGIGGGGRRSFGPGGATAPGAILATRSITDATSTGAVVADSAGRLGQGYRRLAIASPPAPRRQSS